MSLLFSLIVTAAFGTGAQTGVATTAAAAQVYAALYWRGDAWKDDASASKHPSIQAHVRHFEGLGGRLIAAAPFTLADRDEPVGMVLFTADSDAAARQWAETDPAAVAEMMRVRVRRWRVSEVKGWQARPVR